MIERAQFIACLDPAYPIKSPDFAEQLGFMSNRGLHGNGSNECSCNRWFDQAIQVSYCIQKVICNGVLLLGFY